MELDFLTDPAAFLAAAGEHLAADPVIASVVATVAERGVRDDHDGVRREAGVPFWFVVARADDGSIDGVAMRTAPSAPHPMYVLPMTDAAARAVAEALVARGEEVLAVNGCLPAAAVLTEALAEHRGGSAEVLVHSRLFELTALTWPARPGGRLRLAEHGDAELCLEWYRAFLSAADEQAGRPPGSHHDSAEALASILRRIDLGRIHLWEDASGEVVHLTGSNPPAYGAARIGPVYTPPGHRGRGYAARAVAEVTQQILDAGARPCLFTDQANPVSNALYERMGYEALVDTVAYVVR